MLVSVAMISYHHEKYIRKAIESVLQQEKDFAIEIVIGDDCSKDATQNIIREYVKQYPKIISPILRNVNVGASENLYDVIRQCRGKYIAILEGDDYWTDLNKLKKQVEFLENNPEYSACYGKVSIVDENNKIVRQIANDIGTQNGTYSWEDFVSLKLPGQTGTAVFRNTFNENEWLVLTKADELIADRTLALLLRNCGEIQIFNDVLSAYRVVVKKGNSNYLSQVMGKNQLLRMYNIYSELYIFQEEYYPKFSEYVANAKKMLALAAIKEWLGSRTKENKNILLEILAHESLIGLVFYFIRRKLTIRKINNIEKC